MHFIVMSDIHLNRPSAPSWAGRNKKETERFKAIVDWLLRIWPETRPGRPALMFPGDIIHTAHRGDFALVAPQFSRLHNAGFDMLVVPGNHDVDIDGVAFEPKAPGWWMEYVMRPWHRKETGRDLSNTVFDSAYPVFDVIGDTLYVGLDSARGAFARGSVGTSQLADAVAGIQTHRAAVKWVVVYFHHHPFVHSDPTMVMSDADAVMAAIAPLVDVIVFGHQHQWGLWSGPGINTLANVPSGARVKLIVASHKCTNKHQSGIRVVDVRATGEQILVSKPPAA